MHKFFTLVHLEVNRIAKLFFIAMGSYIVLTMINAVYFSRNIMSRLKNEATSKNMSLTQLMNSDSVSYTFDERGMLSMSSVLTAGIIFILILLAIYAFVIWYRDWFGSNKTIYSLLMLPMDRMKVFGAKFLTIFLMGCAAISTFIIALAADYLIVTVVMDKAVLGDMTFISLLNEVINITLYKKSAIVLFAISAICLIFLFTLLERSFRVKGIIIAAVIAAVFLTVNYITVVYDHLYPIEKIIIINILQVINIALTTAYSRFLIKNKVSV